MLNENASSKQTLTACPLRKPLYAPFFVRPLSGGWQASESRLAALREVKIRSLLAKVVIEKGGAPGGKNGVICGRVIVSPFRAACK